MSFHRRDMEWEFPFRSRYDSFCVFSCKSFKAGDYVHIGPHCSFSGPGAVVIGHFATFSHGIHVFTGSDDYSGESMTGPMVPDQYKTKFDRGDVKIGRGVIIGAGCVIMPGTTLNDYCAIGALSFVDRDVPSFEVWGGIPARKLRDRSKRVEELEKEFLRAHPIG